MKVAAESPLHVCVRQAIAVTDVIEPSAVHVGPLVTFYIVMVIAPASDRTIGRDWRSRATEEERLPGKVELHLV